ncbi:MAG: ABC transporter ATP-binding protein [Deltaproteobacteria bacterium]|nr:ABC transporter ATP-binding protein [Deltaproteobacteria bacterium]MBW2084617.1 ABC transporter ATP-binding protein [Deltaproteobacteria bacterium]
MILSVNGVQFSYNSHPVLSDLSFDLPPGQILGILGVNGAGKTTLLKCINKILKPQTGTVLLEKQSVFRMSGNEIAKHFGYVPQKYGDEPLNVFDTVLLGRKPYIKWAVTEHDLEVVERILRLMHLEHMAQRPLRYLSGGETQKVIMARALAQEPEVLLLDEPTANLDLKNQLQVMDLVTNAVREQGLSAVVSMHDINLAFRFVDFFLMLKDGTVHTLTPKEAVSPSMIQEVYGVEVILSQIKDYTVVIPIRHQQEDRKL